MVAMRSSVRIAKRKSLEVAISDDRRLEQRGVVCSDEKLEFMHELQLKARVGFVDKCAFELSAEAAICDHNSNW